MDIFQADRNGPDHAWQVSPSARRRWRAPADDLPEGVSYRPGALSKVAVALEEEARRQPDHSLAGEELLAKHVVAPGDTLSGLALRYYGDAERHPVLFAANRDFLDNPDELFVGDVVKVPRLD